MAIPWVLPSGTIISQSYLEGKTLILRPFAFINSRYNFRFIVENKFDLRKQSNAAMPNLIHSLDASSIALLYKDLSANNTRDLYTTHDCFAVTADKVELLISLLKMVYIRIYWEDIHLKTLDLHVKNTIINTFGPDIFSENHTHIIQDEKENIPYPAVDKVIDTKISVYTTKLDILNKNGSIFSKQHR